nr:CotH kinase family protein [uncultured Acetatifactor sp.]
MISSRYATKIACIAMATAVLLCGLAVVFSGELANAMSGTGIAMEYETELFHTDSIIQIDIQMEEGQWEEMLANAMAEEYYSCDVEINGQRIENVGIRPKGNTSLSSIAMDPDTDRFSLKLEFDHYVEGQTCLGLDKLVLNNNYADATNMKEAIVYDMYRYLGADASLYNYAEISVNGTYWGVYLALEAVEESFLLRNYGAEDGELYKPESMGMGGGADFKPGDIGGREWPEEMPRGDGFSPEGEAPQRPGEETGEDWSEAPQPPEGMPEDMEKRFPGKRDSQEFSEMGGMPGKEFSGNSGGADLNYTDDDLDSYSVIWEGEVTDSGKKDHRRVVDALKNISRGTDLEKYLNIDNILKYMAVHTFSVNLDSLSGNMAHNYYLYEYNGKLNMIPWDYNLSFGGMGGNGDASGTINDAIDTPFQGTEFFNALLEEETYLAQYHEYLQKLTEEYVFGGKFEETYNRIRSQIDTLVETDPTAFYTYEEYKAGAAMLRQTVQLRAESVQGQLSGRIPATDAGQRENPSGLIDASAIDIAVMGTFDMGR